MRRVPVFCTNLHTVWMCVCVCVIFGWVQKVDKGILDLGILFIFNDITKLHHLSKQNKCRRNFTSNACVGNESSIIYVYGCWKCLLCFCDLMMMRLLACTLHLSYPFSFVCLFLDFFLSNFSAIVNNTTEITSCWFLMKSLKCTSSIHHLYTKRDANFFT